MANLKKPISEFLTWDDCVKNEMKNKQMALKEQLLQTSDANPQGITCSGKYGSNQGWTVSCQMKVKNGLSATSTGYQSYPESCQGLPGAINRYVAGSSSSYGGSGQR